MKNKFQILLFYKYVNLDDPEGLANTQKDLCSKLNLKGRIIIAKEGINATVEGLKKDTEEYIKEISKNPVFSNTHFKKSEGTGNAFPKLSIKVREEIVSGHLKDLDVNPNEITGKYLSPEQLHDWIHTDKEFYIVDMRNDYEHAVGYFKNSILPPLTNFRDLPKIVPQLLSLKDKTVVTVCTGGVRCEKASGFLLKSGFSDVYQLYGGIVSYMEKYPNEDFLGKLYVFDGRVTVGFNTDSKDHKVVGKCTSCKSPADAYYDCKNVYCEKERHFVSCSNCIKKQDGYCKDCVYNYLSKLNKSKMSKISGFKIE